MYYPTIFMLSVAFLAPLPALAEEDVDAPLPADLLAFPGSAGADQRIEITID